jgi:hypothetical protein
VSARALEAHGDEQHRRPQRTSQPAALTGGGPEPQPMLAAWRRLRQIEEDAVCVALR